jgi:plastocyanin
MSVRRALLSAGLFTLFVVSLTVSKARSGADPEVTIKLFQFKPTPIEVKAGTRVTWTNTDPITHTVTSGTPENRDGQFNSPLAGNGTSFSFTFTRAGTYSYFCDRHQHMRGEIRVN